MKKQSKQVKQPDTLEQAIAKYWYVQCQWNGQTDARKILTSGQAIKICNTIIYNTRLPKYLRNQVAEFQREMINNSRHKVRIHKGTKPTYNVISIS